MRKAELIKQNLLKRREGRTDVRNMYKVLLVVECEYTEFGVGQKPTRVKGACVSMLIDEEGHYHNLADNLAGSYLYGADKHGCMIVGNILLVGEVDGRDGIDFCGISDSQFQILYPRLEELVKKAGGF